MRRGEGKHAEKNASAITKACGGACDRAFDKNVLKFTAELIVAMTICLLELHFGNKDYCNASYR
eukprot:6198534-Pleurochrysis_carterae.AAC.1